MTTEEEILEKEAVELLNCKKGPSHYIVASAGSIGPSKLVKKSTP